MKTIRIQFNDKTILRSQLRFKNDLHNVCTEEVNKIALSSNDDKRLQTFDRVTIHPYKTNSFKVCKSETMTVRDFFWKKRYVDTKINVFNV